MQPLIHQTAIADLEQNPRSGEITLGDQAELRLEPDGTVSVYVVRPSRLPFGLGSATYRRAGKLGPKANVMMRPALKREAYLRVRVVEVELEHISPKGENAIFISVWGNPSDLAPISPERSIFSSDRINDPDS